MAISFFRFKACGSVSNHTSTLITTASTNSSVRKNSKCRVNNLGMVSPTGTGRRKSVVLRNVVNGGTTANGGSRCSAVFG